VHEAAQRVLGRLHLGEALCADAIAALCRDRAVEVATMPAPLAATLVRNAAEAATRAFSAGDASTRADALSTLRHLLACPPLRDVAIKASRLKSLATSAIEAPLPGSSLPRADAALAAVIQVLRETGVDVTSPGTLEHDSTPLMTAIQHSLFKAAQVLLDAGADVNRLAKNDVWWPLTVAAFDCSDAGMAWLLEHGASLSVANKTGITIAHVLAAAVTYAPPAGTSMESAEFCCRWLRRVIAAEPSLLEARDAEGLTPLMSATATGLEACVAALLELGANVSAVDESGDTPLAFACHAMSLPIVRQLFAAGAASAAALPPASSQARTVAYYAIPAALRAERGCGDCAARCGGQIRGNCADGLDILRAVLAAGVREAVGSDGRSLGSSVGTWMRASDEARRISAEHALVVLQALHAGGVDVLARGPADMLPILHAAAAANAPAVVRWLVAEAGAPLEERDSAGDTPLLTACHSGAWTAAHALLDCGARVDVQSSDREGWWPVLIVYVADCDIALLRRILAADRDSLLRCAAGGFSALHLAASENTVALKLLLGSGLPHLGEAVNAVAVETPTQAGPGNHSTPLHCACRNASWDAALALLAAGARVDIAGHVDGRFRTIAEWARSSPDCKHRGVKLAIAARAREHAAQAAAAVAKGVSAGGAGSGAGVAFAAAASFQAPTNLASWIGNSGSAAAASKEASAGAGPACSDTGAAAGAVAAVASAPTARSEDGAGQQQAKARKGKGRQGAARNRAEAADSDAVSATLAALSAPAAAGTPSPFANTCETTQAVAEAAGCEGPSISEGGSAVGVTAASAACISAAQAHAPPASALNLPEDPSAAPAVGTAAPLSEAEIPSQDSAAVASSNTCEPGAATAASSNTCEPGAAAAASSNTCEPGAAAADSNVCEPGEGTTSADAVAGTAPLQTAEPGTGTGSAGITGSALIAALQDEGASAAAVRRDLAALSELARDPAAAAALERQGAIAVVAAVVLRLGATVARPASALLALLSAAAAEGGEAEDEDGS